MDMGSVLTQEMPNNKATKGQSERGSQSRGYDRTKQFFYIVECNIYKVKFEMRDKVNKLLKIEVSKHFIKCVW